MRLFSQWPSNTSGGKRREEAVFAGHVIQEFDKCVAFNDVRNLHTALPANSKANLGYYLSEPVLKRNK